MDGNPGPDYVLVWAIILPVLAAAIGILAAIGSNPRVGGSVRDKHGRTADSYADERRAIADAAIHSMRAGTFHGNGKKIVNDARRAFRPVAIDPAALRRVPIDLDDDIENKS